MNPFVVVPWHRDKELEQFKAAWRINAVPEWLILQHDAKREGCGVTKNNGIRHAVSRGCDVVVILDGDCYPSGNCKTLEDLAGAHMVALEPQPVQMFHEVTNPPSRGTPYGELTLVMPVAASMGFWLNVPDYCAVRQLAFAAEAMTFDHRPVYGRYFPLCGMNLAFRPNQWWPWCKFIDVPRFDDIWMGWLWQKHAYHEGYCFNLNGPTITHARQSNVWRNLQDEAVHLEANETLWREIARAPMWEYEALRKLLPPV